MFDSSKKQKLVSMTRKMLVSLCLSAGVLSVATIDSVYQEGKHAGDLKQARREASRKVLQARIPAKAAMPVGRTEEFRESLAQDEIGDANPFATLSTLDPISSILNRGIKSFSRQAFRSPDYHEESGYDLVHYEIELNDGSHAQLVAYLERASLTSQRAVGDPDERVPFVMVMSEGGQGMNYSYYRAGDLIENTLLPSSEAQALVARRLSQGIPFLSVAR